MYILGWRQVSCAKDNKLLCVYFVMLCQQRERPGANDRREANQPQKKEVESFDHFMT